MTDTPPPRLYLATPAQLELSRFPDLLAKVLDTADIACLRLSLATRDEDEIARTADVLRDIAHARDVPIIIDSHTRLVARLGLDGVHLPDGPRRLREARKDLGADAIVGAFCGTSRHDGLTAGEIGADYVSFGPVTGSLLDDGAVAGPDLFQWWFEMIEVPVVAEGAITHDALTAIAPFIDFLCLSDEIWQADDPAAALATYARQLATP